jgi:hypothetical protein
MHGEAEAVVGVSGRHDVRVLGDHHLDGHRSSPLE